MEIASSVITAPISLKAAAPALRLPYESSFAEILLPSSSHVVLVLGVLASDKAAAFVHPKLLGKARRMLEFKRSLPNGAKRYSSKPGIEFYFAVPADQVSILPVPHFSYVDAEVNGVSLVFDVSGTSGGGNPMRFTNIVRHNIPCILGLSAANLARIGEVATPPQDLFAAGWTSTTKDVSYGCEDTRWVELLARATCLRKLGEGSPIVLGREAEPGAGETWRVCSFSKGQKVVVQGANTGRWRMSFGLIDWIKTARENGIPVEPVELLRGYRFDPPAPLAMPALQMAH